MKCHWNFTSKTLCFGTNHDPYNSATLFVYPHYVWDVSTLFRAFHVNTYQIPCIDLSKITECPAVVRCQFLVTTRQIFENSQHVLLVRKRGYIRFTWASRGIAIGWFTRKVQISSRREPRVQDLLDWHTCAVMLTPMSSGRGWHGQICSSGEGLRR